MLDKKFDSFKKMLKHYYFYDCDNKKSIFFFEKKVYCIVILFVFLTLVFLYYNMAKLTGEYTNIPKMISEYRMGSMFSNAGKILKLNFFVTQMYRCIEIIGYIFIFILVNNMILKSKLKDNSWNVFIILLVAFISLFISGRTLIIKYIVAFILCYNLLSYKYKGSWKSNSKGWWFEDENGWYPHSQWQKIDGKWYYFCSDGYMDYSEYRDGCWLGSDGAWDENYSNGKWHLDGTGWWYEDNGWYPQNQYLWIDGVRYWFDSQGYMK